jgi:hypothetical protein
MMDSSNEDSSMTGRASMSVPKEFRISAFLQVGVCSLLFLAGVSYAQNRSSEDHVEKGRIGVPITAQGTPSKLLVLSLSYISAVGLYF